MLVHNVVNTLKVDHVEVVGSLGLSTWIVFNGLWITRNRNGGPAQPFGTTLSGKNYPHGFFVCLHHQRIS